MRTKRKAARVLSTYELIDWYCPVYVEIKPGSTDQSAVILEIRGLLDGRYIWNVVYIRQRFPDGRRADWQLGVSAMDSHSSVRALTPVNTFWLALELARSLMDMTPLPIWRDTLPAPSKEGS